MMNRILPSLALGALLLPGSALANDSTLPLEPADWMALDGLVQDDEAPEEDTSVRAEKAAVMSSSSSKAAPSLEEAPARKSVIKTIQKKNFMKLHRYEVGPSIGMVANDPFLNRYIVGGVFDYHVTEIFAVEAQLGYSPILGEGVDDPDLTPLSKQLIRENSVSPDISKLTAHGSVGLAYSPIYGKAAVGSRIIAFDIYGHFGAGFTMTQDDLDTLGEEGKAEKALLTANQVHPTTVFGGGARVAFTKSMAARAEVKSMSYIETISSERLEMKNNLIVQGNVSFFFPSMD
jgi:outer membrane beta-barrel protein